MAAGAPVNTFVMEEKGKMNEPIKEKELGAGICPLQELSWRSCPVTSLHISSATPGWKGVLGMA